MVSIRSERKPRVASGAVPHRLDAQEMSAWVAEQLAFGEIPGRVHSVFRSSFNWTDTNGELYSVIATDLGCTPGGILIVPGPDIDFTAWGVGPGEPVYANARRIQLPVAGVRVVVAHARTRVLSVGIDHRWVVSQDLTGRLAWGGSELCREGARDGLAPLLGHVRELVNGTAATQWRDPIQVRAAAAVTMLVRSCRHEDQVLLRCACESLTGLGPGLTPSGDDVLIGFVSALRAVEGLFGIERWVGTVCAVVNGVVNGVVEGRTTDVAQSYVRHAVHGRVPRSVGEYIEALVCGTESERAAASRRMVRIGSSSGCDMALGVLIGLAGGCAVRDRRESTVSSWKQKRERVMEESLCRSGLS